jgi:hypothetical protein
MLRIIPILLIAALVPSGMALARTFAEDMTCAQVIDTFENTGSVWKRVAGKPMRVTNGVPVRQAQGLTCGPNNYSRQVVTARTTDKRSCVYAVYCHGFDNDKRIRPR